MAGTEPGSPPTYIMGCQVRFESIDVFREALARVGDQLGGDIPNHAYAAPMIQSSRILPSA